MSQTQQMKSTASAAKPSQKRLLFVINSLAGGGAEKILVRLIQGIDHRRYLIHLVLIAKKLDYLGELPSHIRISQLGKTSRWQFLSLLGSLTALIRREQPDTVISLLEYANVLSAMAFRRSGARGRLLLCEHNFPFHAASSRANRWLMPWLVKRAYPRADRIIVVAKEMKRHMVKTYHFPQDKIMTIYNPIPLAEVRKLSHAPVSHRFFEQRDVRIFISAGRLELVKRQDRLLRVFAMARRQGPNLRLLILGKGSLEKELKELSRQLGISEDVDFVGFQSNPYAWIARSAAFVLTSDNEGFPNVLIEAMACNVPVVSVDCQSGPAEIITDGHNGLLVPRQDENRLTAALLQIAGDPQLCRNLAMNGQKFAEQFDTERIIPQYEQEF